jgi:hypothetical protein
MPVSGTDVFTLQVATQPVIKVNFNVQKRFLLPATKDHDFVRLAPNFGFVPATHAEDQRMPLNLLAWALACLFINILNVAFQQQM